MMTLEPPRGLAVNAGQSADAWRAVGLSASGLGRFVGVARVAVGLAGEVDVLLAGDRTLRRLNREFRGKDKATDVLSFPAAPEMGEAFAGDLAISLDTAGRQARAHGHSLRDEVRVLLLHGLLHLSGMDHEVDGGEMAAREAALRVRLRLPGGLIERVGGAAKTKATATAKVKADSGILRLRLEDDGEKQATARARAKTRSRSPAGMTTEKAKATAGATVRRVVAL